MYWEGSLEWYVNEFHKNAATKIKERLIELSISNIQRTIFYLLNTTKLQNNRGEF